MTSSWLSGIPTGSCNLSWSSSGEWASVNVGDPQREGTSLLDGVLLYWFSSAGNDSHTVIFLADTICRGEDEPVIISKVSELDYVVHKAALVGKSEFATAEWIESDHILKFRLHLLNGSLVRERPIPVADAYGDLRVFGQKVCICISSGKTSEKITHLDKHWHDSLGGFQNPSDLKLYGDQILEWDITSGTLRTIGIVNPICHGAEFHLIDDHKMVLAGLDGLDNDEEPVLVYFDDQDQAGPCLFSVGATAEERHSKSLKVAIRGSTEPSDILVHSFDRIAVYSQKILNRAIVDNPRTGRFHYVNSLLPQHDIRVLPFSVPGHLPAIVGNRVLACQRIGSSKEFQFFILDFDQDRLRALIDSRKEEWDRMQTERASMSRVTVVTRQYVAQASEVGGGCVDVEYPAGRVPLERQDHVRDITNKEKEGIVPNLIFDEAPEGRREGRFGFVQSMLHLGREFTLGDTRRIGLTTKCVVLAPEPGDDGRIWYFE